MRKLVTGVCGCVCALLLGTGSAFAAYTAIDNPDADYLAGTGKCVIDGVPVSPTSTCTDAFGSQVMFSPVGQARQVPSSWATWSSPPFSESSTPKISFWPGTMATLDYGTQAVDGFTIGSEWEPNSFSMFTIVCSFQSGGATVVSVSRPVVGMAGARLFAVASDGDPGDPSIDTIVCSIPAGAQGFATAQIRSDGLTSAAASSDNGVTGAAGNNGLTNAY